jgi:phospholipid N-methyltransferase
MIVTKKITVIIISPQINELTNGRLTIAIQYCALKELLLNEQTRKITHHDRINDP